MTDLLILHSCTQSLILTIEDWVNENLFPSEMERSVGGWGSDDDDKG